RLRRGALRRRRAGADRGLSGGRGADRRRRRQGAGARDPRPRPDRPGGGGQRPGTARGAARRAARRRPAADDGRRRHRPRRPAAGARRFPGGRAMSLAVPPLRTTDPAAFGRVAVLMGGTSAEREVSLQSGQGVLEALRARGVDAHAVDGIPALVEATRTGTLDRVFTSLHGNRGGGADGVVQGLLGALGVPYTGAGVLGSALAMDKIRTRQVWLAEGLPTPRFARVPPGGDLRAAIAKVGPPAFAKPSCEGSSVGAARVVGEGDIANAVGVARAYGGEMLVEEMVVGDEITVAILGDVALPSIRIVPAGEWYDYNAKYLADDTQYLCPGLDEAGERAAAG